MEAKDEDVHVVLPCKLTDDDRVKTSRLVAQAWLEYEEIEDAKKEAAAKETKKLKAKRAEIADLAGILREGFEPRPVKCRWVEDLNHGVKRLVRQDTGDIVREVTLSADDLQRPFEFNS